jgi:threonine dehydratase
MIQLDDVIRARRIIARRIHRTPLITSTRLGEQHNVHLHFKVEAWQKTGSFKPRGSINKLYHLTKNHKEQGVITVSSGNHAQGFAFAASLFGIQATVVMSEKTPPYKIHAARYYGAEVILSDADLFGTALTMKKERNLIMVQTFDDPFIIAGHGIVKILTETAGAAGFAALLFQKVKIPAGSEVVCILSGGNIDRSRMRSFFIDPQPVSYC